MENHASQNLHVGRWVAAGIGAIVLLVAIGWGIWALGVATSGIHGRGEQIKQVNKATNRTFAQ
jgi:hypothetical protein